ncbi:MAG: type I-C CRISPR-associated endonuclease Cas1c [Oscillospiraceae bacterium]|nr:type I-C CRISPR-associated endonuclease Cas1c [Oscillospiraceae bacterium]
MRHLLNTLFVTLEDAYATLDGENVVIRQDDTVAGRFPLHILEGIYLFSYAGASPALMGKCAKEGINLVFLTPRGRFLARTCGESRGNVLLRRAQYRAADDPFQSCRIARNFIFGKLSNARQVLDRARRDHGERLDAERFQAASDQLKALLPQVLEETFLESLRGLEGAGATVYFGLFDEMILRNKDAFFFRGRNRRPPLDCVNAMLSFIYVMLGNDCASALEMVGLDAYVGFLHWDRPGRTSLAQDLLEELRPCMADRFALTVINNQIISPSDFQTQENGAVLLTPEGRKKIQKEWQQKKQEKITHPFLKEKLEWGLIPYVQALLLARCLRGDLDGYPPFLWR